MFQVAQSHVTIAGIVKFYLKMAVIQKCTSRGLLESSPTSGNTIGAGQGNMV